MADEQYDGKQAMCLQVPAAAGQEVLTVRRDVAPDRAGSLIFINTDS
jgi:hypothetical protein